MVRVGERVLCVPMGDNGDRWYILGARTPRVGDRVLLVPTADGKKYYILKPYNAYQDDQCITLPLRNNRVGVCIAGEPPNYIHPSWGGNGGSGMSFGCTEGVPSTSGWTCNGSCPISPNAGNICNRERYGWIDPEDPNFCIHPSYKYHWTGNRYAYFWKYKWMCLSSCKWREYKDMFSGVTRRCPNYGAVTWQIVFLGGSKEGQTAPSGCYDSSYRRGQLYSIMYYYKCDGCPGVNGSLAPCTIQNGKGPVFSPGGKPSGCRYPQYLSFDGWEQPGASDSAQTACAFSKGTEGISTNSNQSGDGNIRCKFMGSF